MILYVSVVMKLVETEPQETPKKRTKALTRARSYPVANTKFSELVNLKPEYKANRNIYFKMHTEGLEGSWTLLYLFLSFSEIFLYFFSDKLFYFTYFFLIFFLRTNSRSEASISR